jgi:hypothetical protein
MRKIIILVAGIISILFIIFNSSIKDKGFYGTYKFEELSYLSPLSSYSTDYLIKGLKDNKYIIKNDLFRIESKGHVDEIQSPNYVRKPISKVFFGALDINYILGKEVKYQYDIYDKEKRKTNLRLYVSRNYLWIATYADNTADGSEIILSLYKLGKY